MPQFTGETSIWRVSLKVSLFWVLYLAILRLVSFAEGFVPPALSKLFWGIASSILILAITFFFLRREKRSPVDVGLGLDGFTPARFGLGALIAFATYGAIVILICAFLGRLHFIRATIDPASIALTVCTTLALACMEELGFRAYSLRTLVPAVGYWPAQIVVAVAFGLCHKLFNYPWSAILMGVIPCALVFGTSAIASRGLAMPIGVHAGLNLAQWAVGERGLRGGLWTTAVDHPAQDRIAAYSPIIVVSVTLLVAGLFWLWHQRETRASEM